MTPDPHTAKSPTPAQVDALCVTYEKKKAANEKAGDALATAKAALLAKIDQFGYVPAHADKSRRLDGIGKIATATTSNTIEIRADAVTKLQLRLSRLKMPRLFAELFARQVKYSLVKGAGETITVAVQKLPAPRRAPLLGLFSSCFEVNSKTPSLAVEDVAALKAKEEKAAKKAAKKAGAK
jgi:hypothetical protein